MPLTLIAQEQENSTVKYGQSYFTQYKPVTLQDMIRNIPGGTTILNSLKHRGSGRGFGSSGAQILINGKRMSGKSNDMGKNITRIQASQVDYIELIRGNAEGLDIRNEGILINVTLKKGAENAKSTFAEVKFDYTRQGQLRPEGLVSHNGKSGNLEYGVSYQLDRSQRIHNVAEDILSSNFIKEGYRFLVNDKKDHKNIFTGNLGYNFQNGDQVRLNGLYSKASDDEFYIEDQFLVALGGGRVFTGVEEFIKEEAETNWEIGGDYQGDFGELGNLKALFVINKSDNLDTITQDQVTGNSRDRFFESVGEYALEEKIFRASMTSTINSSQILEWGGEGAFNILNKDQAFNVGGSDVAIVKEDRYEAFITHSWTLNNKMFLQSSFVEEFSTIFQDRLGVTNERSFKYLKPRFEFRYDVTGKDQIRIVAERTVSQLNLSNFVASRNTEDDTISFGNPDLVPEKRWVYSLGYEKRFDNDAGSIEAKISYEDISDHIDRILIGVDESATGNIGDGRWYGADIKANIRFGFIGIPNAVASLSYRYRDTQTTDPFTGLLRETKSLNPHYWNIDFQHELTDLNLMYGFNFHKRAASFRQDVYLTENRQFLFHSSLFGEYKFMENMKMRLDIRHIFNDRKKYYKTYYQGNIANNIVDRIDSQINETDTFFHLSFQATF